MERPEKVEKERKKLSTGSISTKVVSLPTQIFHKPLPYPRAFFPGFCPTATHCHVLNQNLHVLSPQSFLLCLPRKLPSNPASQPKLQNASVSWSINGDGVTCLSFHKAFGKKRMREQTWNYFVTVRF